MAHDCGFVQQMWYNVPALIIPGAEFQPVLVIKRLSREKEKMSKKLSQAIGFNVHIEPESILQMVNL